MNTYQTAVIDSIRKMTWFTSFEAEKMVKEAPELITAAEQANQPHRVAALNIVNKHLQSEPA